jgi:hypothetical protein
LNIKALNYRTPLNIDFDELSNKVIDEFWYSDAEKETISIQVDHGIRRIEIYYDLNVDGIKNTVLTYFFDLDKENDTIPGYRYYTLNSNGYTFKTDFDRFQDECINRDSMYIEYTETCLDEIPFDEFGKSVFIPNLSNFKSNKVYNTLHLANSDNKCLTGIMWSFIDKNMTDSAFTYQRIIFNGDLIARQRKFMIELSKLKNDYPTNEIQSTSKLMDLFKLVDYDL